MISFLCIFQKIENKPILLGDVKKKKVYLKSCHLFRTALPYLLLDGDERAAKIEVISYFCFYDFMFHYI